MASGGGETGSSFECDDNKQMSSLESSGVHHHDPHRKKNSNRSNVHHGHFPISRKSVIRMTQLFIAVAVAFFVLHSSGYPNQYFSITLYNPLSSLSQGSTKANHSSLPFGRRNFSHSPDELLQENGSETTNSMSSTADLSSPRNTPQETPFASDNQTNEKSKLEKVLNEAATADKTVTIATLNAAWIAPNSIFDLFLESFRVGNGTQRLLYHVVVIALDQKAYSRCLELHPHCYALSTEGVDFSGQADYMTPDYLKIMWRRMEFLQTVLEMGYNFIVTDVDIMWFRDPFAHFYKDADIQVSSDHYWHSPTYLNNIANTGFYYVKSNKNAIQFFKFWCRSKDKFPARHDQHVFNKIRHDRLINKIGLKIRFLDTAFYGGFCEPSKDLRVVCTMHANCCVGLDRKIHDLKMLIDDWKKYMSLPSEERTEKPQTWTVQRICGRNYARRKSGVKFKNGTN